MDKKEDLLFISAAGSTDQLTSLMITVLVKGKEGIRGINCTRNKTDGQSVSGVSSTVCVGKFSSQDMSRNRRSRFICRPFAIGVGDAAAL